MAVMREDRNLSVGLGGKEAKMGASNNFLYDRQQLPAQCEVEVGGDYYYIGPQRAGLPPNLKVRSGRS